MQEQFEQVYKDNDTKMHFQFIEQALYYMNVVNSDELGKGKQKEEALIELRDSLTDQ